MRDRIPESRGWLQVVDEVPGRMTGLPVGSLPSSMSSAAGVLRDGGVGEREHSEELDELVPLDRLPSGGDFRGKFRKIRQRKRPTILESRCRSLFF